MTFQCLQTKPSIENHILYIKLHKSAHNSKNYLTRNRSRDQRRQLDEEFTTYDWSEITGFLCYCNYVTQDFVIASQRMFASCPPHNDVCMYHYMWLRYYIQQYLVYRLDIQIMKLTYLIYFFYYMVVFVCDRFMQGPPRRLRPFLPPSSSIQVL